VVLHTANGLSSTFPLLNHVAPRKNSTDPSIRSIIRLKIRISGRAMPPAGRRISG
jgi:hypothetical protein